MTVATAAVVGPEPDVITRREGSAGVIRLNRPKAINALSLEMSLEMTYRPHRSCLSPRQMLGRQIEPVAIRIEGGNRAPITFGAIIPVVVVEADQGHAAGAHCLRDTRRQGRLA